MNKMKQISLGLGLITLLLWPGKEVLAANEIEVNVRIEGPSANIVDQAVQIPDSCTVTDSAGGTHTFTNYEAICALQVLKEAGTIDFQATDWGWAMALDSITNIKNASDWSESWFIRINSATSNFGIDSLVLNPNDRLLLGYGGWPFPEPLLFEKTDNAAKIGDAVTFVTKSWKDDNGGYEDYQSPVIFYLKGTPISSENGEITWTVDTIDTFPIWVEAVGKIRSPKYQFEPKATEANYIGNQVGLNTKEAVDFLEKNQNKDGSFAKNQLFSDWAAIALSTQDTNNSARQKITNYLLQGRKPGKNTTDYERRALALLTLGINPYDVNGRNYIEPIVNDFDGTQIGNKDYVNDDIFGLLVLRKSGFDLREEIITKLTNHILSNQNKNGSWAESTDMTSAAIQALQTVEGATNVYEALEKAKRYIRTQQKTNGSFNNSAYSTTWAIQAITTLGMDASDWYKNDNTPVNYLAALQEPDGGLGKDSPIEMRIWLTSYAIPASLGKSWADLMHEFPKGEIKIIEKKEETQETLEETKEEIISEKTELNIKENIKEDTEPLEPEPKLSEEVLKLKIVEDISVEEPKQNIISTNQIERERPVEIAEVVDNQTEEKIIENEDPVILETVSADGSVLAAADNLPTEGSNSARNVFRTATTLATTLGAYLAWRALQTIV